MKISWTVLSYRADTTISQKLLFSISKGHNSKNMQSRVTVLALCTSSHVALHLCKVSWKYLKRFWSYRADTILWQTDRQTDRRPGQKQDVSQPYGGRHNKPQTLQQPHPRFCCGSYSHRSFSVHVKDLYSSMNQNSEPINQDSSLRWNNTSTQQQTNSETLEQQTSNSWTTVRPTKDRSSGPSQLYWKHYAGRPSLSLRPHPPACN